MPTISQSTVTQLQPGQRLVDDKVPGFTCRKLPSGRLSYGLRYSLADGRERWYALGVGITPERARKLAEQRRGDVAAGKDPQGERQAERRTRAHTVGELLDEHVKRYVRGAARLRSADEIERCFKVYVKPEIGKVPIYSLKRSDIVAMLDGIEEDNGPVMADRVLAHLRKAFTWHAARDDRFNSPIIRGMARTKPSERARKRTLTDVEIRDLWEALDSAKVPSCFRSLVRFLLLSARRKSEAAGMHWREAEGDAWVIPAERGERQGHKTADEAGELVIPLTPSMRAQMGEEPKRKSFVFSTTGGKVAFNGFGKAKKALDDAIAELREAAGRDEMPAWTIHDLRRTARSLMSRAGVDGDVAERVLGHAIPGVRGVYDRHAYLDEKRDALERLAKLVEQILAGKTDSNVRSLEEARASRQAGAA